MEHLEQRKKVFIMLAIMSAMLFAALNQTIVGTALPRIIADLGGMKFYSWVFTIYMLTSSITAVLVGKLSDIYGRKPFILIGIGIFTIGSFLSGFSNTIIQLIVFRGIQGFGAGMIMSTAFASIGDLFAPRERGRWQGLMSAVFGLASVFGPTLGGYIVDNADWHWVFWVFLPFGAVALIMIWTLFPSQAKKGNSSIDYFGSLMLSLTIIPLLLAFTWGGKDYEWASVQIIGLFAGTIIALILFIIIENKASNPVLPLALFKNNIFSLSNLIGFLLGAGMFGAIMYMPMFVQGVIGTSATKSGLVMMPMTLSMVVASAIGGQLITKTGKYKIIALAGLLIMGSGLFLLSEMSADTSNYRAVMNMITVGIGLGLSFPVFTLTIQNAVEHKHLGVATASAQLFRQIGGTVGVAVLGTVMNSKMTEKMKELGHQAQGGTDAIPPAMKAKLSVLQDPQLLMDPEKLEKATAGFPPEMKQLLEHLLAFTREALSFALTNVFFIGALIIAAAFCLTLFMKEIPLRQSNKGETIIKEEDKPTLRSQTS
ncbi:MDR family MFS transporter [Falsibacillus albus]|uniref:DHA2 family efflux MFS transporter permease subunit n=1 Tax=Falsibacillus albus TaxID=2478915 RepID=A0A3L7K3C6_9BACI|nr:MDR family MFS transporter [Falsibacillus albus]RLQ95212.1 DHA2 family efflux MFS transporter permease subunit [Falsibacillus albus]